MIPTLTAGTHSPSGQSARQTQNGSPGAAPAVRAQGWSGETATLPALLAGCTRRVHRRDNERMVLRFSPTRVRSLLERDRPRRCGYVIDAEQDESCAAPAAYIAERWSEDGHAVWRAGLCPAHAVAVRSTLGRAGCGCTRAGEPNRSE